MSYRPCILDLEASGLGAGSYPIEVGLALPDGRRYCRLIKPANHWTHWDESAQDLHKISRKLLEDRGYHPREIARELNTILLDRQVYSDGWVVDEPWIIRLFAEAKIDRAFAFYDIQTILSEAQMDIWHEEKDKVLQELHLARHRASNDALIIQETFVRTRKRAANAAKLVPTLIYSKGRNISL